MVVLKRAIAVGFFTSQQHFFFRRTAPEYNQMGLHPLFGFFDCVFQKNCPPMQSQTPPRHK